MYLGQRNVALIPANEFCFFFYRGERWKKNDENKCHVLEHKKRDEMLFFIKTIFDASADDVGSMAK